MARYKYSIGANCPLMPLDSQFCRLEWHLEGPAPSITTIDAMIAQEAVRDMVIWHETTDDDWPLEITLFEEDGKRICSVLVDREVEEWNYSAQEPDYGKG